MNYIIAIMNYLNRTTKILFIVTLVSMINCASSTGDVQKGIDARIASLPKSNEASATSSLKTLQSAEVMYQATNGVYGTLKQMAEAQLVDPTLASGEKNGYRFEVRVKPSAFEAVATPIEYGRTGVQSFYMNEEGIIHSADKKGAEANAGDPRLGS